MRILLVVLAAGLVWGQTGLKDAYAGAFKVGAALNAAQFTGEKARDVALVERHFNTITPENVLKWESVHPRPDEYSFEMADRYVEFGERRGLFVVGHTLVWHSQTPRWVFEGEGGRGLTRDELLARMREHIHKVVGRYKGRIHGWDVVNEALNEDGTMRQSAWLRIIGEDYVEKAFEYAREADPAAALYYNDYSVENEPKRKGAVALVRRLQARGIKVAAVGLQGHNRMDWPSVEQQEATIAAFRELGVKVAITELDVDVLPRAPRVAGADVGGRAEYRAEIDPYRDGLPAEVEQAQARRYAELFKVYLKNKDVVERVTFWGVADDGSWLNNFPVRGRVNHPLLFDRKGVGKAALGAVMGVAGR